MANEQSQSDQQEDSNFFLGEISSDLDWLSKAIDRLDRNISEDRDKIAQWKSSIEERVTLVLRCTKDLKAGERDLQNWKNDIDSRLKAQETWKAQHSQIETWKTDFETRLKAQETWKAQQDNIETWKTDKETRMKTLETWKDSQSGGLSLLKYLGTGVVGAIITFLLIYVILPLIK